MSAWAGAPSLLALALLGCASTPQAVVAPPPPPPQAPQRPVALKVRTMVERAGAQKEALPGERLLSGDCVRFWVTLEEQAHVYLLTRPTGKPPEVIYPPEGYREARQGEFQFPPDSCQLLDDEVGVEQYVFFAAREPVAHHQLIATAAQMPQPRIAPPPPAAETKKTPRRKDREPERGSKPTEPATAPAQGQGNLLAAATIDNAPFVTRGSMRVAAPPKRPGAQSAAATQSAGLLGFEHLAFGHDPAPAAAAPARRKHR